MKVERYEAKGDKRVGWATRRFQRISSETILVISTSNDAGVRRLAPYSWVGNKFSTDHE